MFYFIWYCGTLLFDAFVRYIRFKKKSFKRFATIFTQAGKKDNHGKIALGRHWKFLIPETLYVYCQATYTSGMIRQTSKRLIVGEKKKSAQLTSKHYKAVNHCWVTFYLVYAVQGTSTTHGCRKNFFQGGH